MANLSGYNATLKIGTYSVASLDDVRVSVDHEPVDVSDLADTWRAMAGGILDWEVTGTRKFTCQKFLTLVDGGRTSVAIRVGSPATTNLFSGTGYITRGASNFPMGAAGEEITIVGTGSAPTKP